MALSFFGLTFDQASTLKRQLFQQIHEIVFHGKGGYDWGTVYNMPTWLRRFTFKEIKEYYEEEKKQIENSQKSKNKGSNTQTLVRPDGSVNKAAFQAASKNYQK